MQKVVCFGEALIDFLPGDQLAEGPIPIHQFRQYPGGAPANAAVAVSKLGGNAHFVGQVGNDSFGDFLSNALHAYGVNTEHLLKHPTAPTSLAFVSLDESGERSFSFYREDTADVLMRPEQLSPKMFADAAILHFCSITLSSPLSALTTQAAVELGKQAGALISFDVNLRHNLWPGGQADAALVDNMVAKADVLKFSKEEIDYLSRGDIIAYVQQCLNNGCRLLVITDGGATLNYYTQKCQGQLAAPEVKVVDTTAGGDGFSGGLLFLLSQVDDLSSLITRQDKLDRAIGFAIACGAHAVTKPGAFPALPTFADVARHFPDKL